MKSIIKNKVGAIELSISTVVIIVIGMSMLVLGLVLVRTIFTSATDSIDTLDQGVRDEIAGLFAKENQDIVVKLGEGKTARIKPSEDIFRVGFGARTPDGSATGSRTRLQYKLTLETPTGSNCASILGQRQAEDLLLTPLNSFRQFDEFQGSSAFALIEIKTPKGTATCTQKVFIDVKDTESGQVYAGSFFKMDILKEGLF